MIPMERPSAQERQLLKLYRALSPEDRAAVVAFGRFLAAGGASAMGESAEAEAAGMPSAPPEAPRHEPRPHEETVVAAIKRLRRVYPMLDPGEMLHETSSLMAAHILQGRDAVTVIDELERLFVVHYEARSRPVGAAETGSGA